jgi:hypothetical protein
MHGRFGSRLQAATAGKQGRGGNNAAAPTHDRAQFHVKPLFITVRIDSAAGRAGNELPVPAATNLMARNSRTRQIKVRQTSLKC